MDPNSELKILSDNGASFMVGGYGVLFGGADLTRDRFTKATDFWFDRITQNPPVLYEHGQDPTMKKQVVGRITSTRTDDLGVWVEAQITAAKRYADAIRQLIAKGVLGWSSGSVPHLVQRTKSATPGVTEITSWPIVEFSLTPNPAEPRTVGVKELKALAAADPLLISIAREAEQAATKEAKVAMTDLPDSAFAFIAPGGTLDDEKKTHPRSSRLYPHHDAAGDVDPEALKVALAEATKDGAHIEAIAQLLQHVHALETGARDDAHDPQWREGAAPHLLVASATLKTLAESQATDRLAMEQLHLDTKSGGRFDGSRLAQLKSLVANLAAMIEHAERIDRGEDGKARVDMFRHRLALLELAEVS